MRSFHEVSNSSEDMMKLRESAGCFSFGEYILLSGIILRDWLSLLRFLEDRMHSILVHSTCLEGSDLINVEQIRLHFCCFDS